MAEAHVFSNRTEEDLMNLFGLDGRFDGESPDDDGDLQVNHS